MLLNGLAPRSLLELLDQLLVVGKIGDALGGRALLRFIDDEDIWSGSKFLEGFLELV